MALVIEVLRQHGRVLAVETTHEGMTVLLVGAPSADDATQTLGIRLPLSDDKRADLIRALGGIVDYGEKWKP